MKSKTVKRKNKCPICKEYFNCTNGNQIYCEKHRKKRSPYKTIKGSDIGLLSKKTLSDNWLLAYSNSGKKYYLNLQDLLKLEVAFKDFVFNIVTRKGYDYLELKK